MKRLDRMTSKKSHSWWWNSHISPKNSKWLAENLEEMDRSVKEMLKLIEEEGDSFAKKAEMYYKRRPELISHVEDFYRMYRALAERYDQVTGELRNRIPTELQPQNSGSGSDYGSEPLSPLLPLSPELTPESKPPRLKPNSRAAGFDFFLSSSGSLDHSRKGGNRSSPSSDSDSDSGDFSRDSNGDNNSELHQRIHELENELCDVNTLLHGLEQKNSNGQCTHLDSEVHEECISRISELENKLSAADEKAALETTEVELEGVITVLEAEVSHYKQEICGLKEAMEAATVQFEADLLHRDQVIQKYEAEVAEISKTFSHEKVRLESEVANFESDVEDLRSEMEKILTEKSLLEVKITEHYHMVRESESNAARSVEESLRTKSVHEAQLSTLEAKLISYKDEIKILENEKIGLISYNTEQIEELNKDMDALRLRVDMLTAEKDELNVKMSTILIDIKHRDERIGLMSEHMHQLHLEHANLITEAEVAQRATDSLRSQVAELEEAVDAQRAAISDAAELKREAIRQLCFSLDYYRDRYRHQRQALRQ